MESLLISRLRLPLCAAWIRWLPSFLPNPAGLCLNTMLNLFIGSAKEKGETQSLEDKVTDSPSPTGVKLAKPFKHHAPQPSPPQHLSPTIITSSTSTLVSG